MDTHFSCVGCGKCCSDHHVPLTLDEAVSWAGDGGTLIVLTEGFLNDGLGAPPAHQREHAQMRSWPLKSGTALAHVAITFAAYNAGRCRNLSADNRCNIYATRPLVCRIYPMEINPHIPLTPSAKDCPTESWEERHPALIVSDRLVDSETAALIERSRQADRQDIAVKAAICAELGINTIALKGDGFIACLPDTEAFLAAARKVARKRRSKFAAWNFQVSDEQIAMQLRAAGATVKASQTINSHFIALRAA